MKKEEITVAQSIYSRVKADFKLGAARISKSAILDWTITYVENGVQKTANADTVGRKLRLLVESNYLGVEYDERHQAWIIPATGKPTPIVETNEEIEPPKREKINPVRFNRVAHFFDTVEAQQKFLQTHEGALIID